MRQYTEQWLRCVRGQNDDLFISKKFIDDHLELYLIRESFGSSTAVRIRIIKELLAKYIGDDVLIPHAIEDRKTKFPEAFKELESYMQKFLKAKSIHGSTIIF